ncbi:AMP-binding protein [Propylenella binzhouense]|uniref:AMP-dependent synthetase n=1 Tax=Propylenella binzhouense TaxID=2555902 RepID=A0A964WUG2_9HYPH|nr:AMP-binding protein [Propylenella binzhouense]MYZ48993.1 AMP-dependent synthetase [Propylenella binzhouense]
MLPIRSDYESLRRDFRWALPARFNMARACLAGPGKDAPAILQVQGDGTVVPWTGRRLAAEAARLANALQAAGIARGDRIAILLPQSAETAITHLAAWSIGAVTVPMAVLFGTEALRYRLADSEAVALVTHAPCLEKIAGIRDELGALRLVIGTDGPGHGAVGWEELVGRAADRIEIADTAPDDPAVMVYTSGTTGPPKGALHGHRVLLGHLPGVEMSHEFLPRPGDRLWTPADWAWAGGLFNVLLPALYFGVPVVAQRSEGFDPEAAFALMARLGIRNAFIPPTALKMLRSVPDPRGRFAPALRTVASGGESLGREAYEWGRGAFGLTINEFYGQTECNYVLSSCAALGVSRPGSIGKAVPGHDVAIVDGEGRPLPPGAQGEIAIRTPDPVMFLRYWRRPEATEEKIRNGWMLTGDQASRDEDGYFRFLGRDDDVITSSGYRIGPGEIEDCLIGHPAVRLAAAVGKPDPVRTEIVKAYVVLNDGHQPSDPLAEEIRTFVRTRLSAHEYPREVAFVPDVPLTTTGKVIRRHFREAARREAEAEGLCETGLTP